MEIISVVPSVIYGSDHCEKRMAERLFNRPRVYIEGGCYGARAMWVRQLRCVTWGALSERNAPTAG